MESYGVILKKAREELGLDLEKISGETSIKADYLKAIEEEDQNVFQDIGETYFVGFLRNYSDYLGCNTQNVMNLYRARKLQESPVPEGLIIKHRPGYVVPLIVFSSIIVAAGLGFGGFKLFTLLQQKKEASKVVQTAVFKRCEITDKPLSTRLYVGDKIVVPSENGEIIVTVSKTLGSLAMETPVGTQFVELSEELEIDCDGDKKNEFIVYLSEISSKDEKNGAEVRLLLCNSENYSENAVDTTKIPGINEVSHADTKVTIIEDTRAYPFTLNISFRAGALIRYKVDRRDTVEDYYTKGDLVTMTASNGIRLGCSNGNTMGIQVIANGKSYDLEVSKAGQVVAEDIKWIRDTDGKYKLVVLDLD